MSNIPCLFSNDTPPVNLDKIRRIWHNNEWYFNVTDVLVQILETDYKHAKSIWSTMKQRLGDAYPVITENRTQLKMKAISGKMYLTDVMNAKGLTYLYNEFLKPNLRRKQKRLQDNKDEVEQFHPRVEAFLLQDGYEIQHHVSLPSGCIIDFVAKKAGQTLVIECKSSLSQGKLYDAVGQILCYCAEFEHLVTPCIALPTQIINDYAISTCKRMQIQLLEIGDDSWKGTIDPHQELRRAVKFVSTQYRTQGKSDTWVDIRIQTIISNKQFIEALKAAVVNAPSNLYAQATDRVYLGLWERTTAQLRNELQVDERKNPRDSFGEYALIYTRLTEMVITNKLDNIEIVTMTMAMDIVWEVAQLIHTQAQATAHALGMDLVTEKRLLSGGE